ncbi:MAG: hypothetical protein ACREPY_06075 [Rhodanobacteraceae bacterium]
MSEVTASFLYAAALPAGAAMAAAGGNNRANNNADIRRVRA